MNTSDSPAQLTLTDGRGRQIRPRLTICSSPVSFLAQIDPGVLAVARDVKLLTPVPLAARPTKPISQLTGLARAAAGINRQFGCAPHPVVPLSAGRFSHLKGRARAAASINASLPTQPNI